MDGITRVETMFVLGGGRLDDDLLAPGQFDAHTNQVGAALTERYRDITVRMLLNHSSGLPGGSYANSFGYKYHNPFLQETLRTLARSHLKHAPGERAVYCNDGFSLAEIIVERVSGKKYSTFLAQRIFAPKSSPTRAANNR